MSLKRITKPHIESFNFFIEHGIDMIVQSLDPQYVDPIPQCSFPGLKCLSFAFILLLVWIKEVELGMPVKKDDSSDQRLFPSEARCRNLSYSAPLVARFAVQLGNSPVDEKEVSLGNLPIMVLSKRCHLNRMTPEALVEHKEEEGEMGGYFIINGIERAMRLLILSRRNYPHAIIRPSFKNRGSNYTEYAVVMRSARPDQSSHTINLHYLSSGTITMRIGLRKQEFFLPLIIVLKALIQTTDREIYNQIVAENSQKSFICDRVELMLLESSQTPAFHSQTSCLDFIGSRFRSLLGVSDSMSNTDVGSKLLSGFVLVNTNNNREKFDMLIFMTQKLFALVAGEIDADNMDALSNHEVLLPGHMFNMLIREKLENLLISVQTGISKDLANSPEKVALSTPNSLYFKRKVDSMGDVGKMITYFITTGNLLSRSGLNLMQKSGFSIVAEKINPLRYLSHFRAIHRGQFFSHMKTTTVRKLLPESWGFMCPVHTPDGAPCGLLNHISAECELVSHDHGCIDSMRKVLLHFGMTSIDPPVVHSFKLLRVILDGVVVGVLHPLAAIGIVKQLRQFKIVINSPKEVRDKVISKLPPFFADLPVDFEVSIISDKTDYIFPGVYIMTTAARFVRQVRHIESNRLEWIGSFEQIFLEIASTEDDIRPGITTHIDISPISMLSINASIIPFSDHNQSPRNMYQCQMGKQTMGTPFHSIPYRVDNKIYRIQTPQSPIVKNKSYDEYSMDEYPSGANAVVAVISYTGFDMEDAMIINKSSYERGFGHGTVYTNRVFDLSDRRKKGEPVHDRFSNQREDGSLISYKLDYDGLPFIGEKVSQGDPLVCIVNETTGEHEIISHKSEESAYIENIRVFQGNDMKSPEEAQQVCIVLRYNRNPIIGDKFSSRHGQKGVLSQLWPAMNMPFTESGITPDVIINPHAFPSRMTIGMLIESMAGKSGALKGNKQDATPFQFNEQNMAVDYFGKALLESGYNYCGSETMISGITGLPLKADIFVGLVYYQRLRHMVSDKSQVRATGPVNALTHQPVKGRKKHGGVRFGEMERDSLLAHGAAFLLNDRLMKCSDSHESFVCSKCGSILSPLKTDHVTCLNCNTDTGCQIIRVPYVFSYLVTELAAMNIRVTLDIK